MKHYFADVVNIINANLTGNEQFTAWFSAEVLDFARFNHAKIRQAGTIHQQFLEIDLILGRKHASKTIGLSNDLTVDAQTISEATKELRSQLSLSEDDPYLMIHEGNISTECITTSELSNKHDTVKEILKQGEGLDLVGTYYGGPIFKGFANSFGQFNWFEKSSFIIDTSIYHSGDKAIKQSYADVRFDHAIFSQKMDEAKRGLALFDKEPITIKPGSYRVYLAPAAVAEIIELINWGGFSRKMLEVKSSPLLPLALNQKQFAKTFSLSESIENGVGPNFQAQGFMKEAHLPIIENGELRSLLVSPKTAKEYGLTHNGADDGEILCAIDMKAGSLYEQDILSTLGDGLYINNLWYLNFSDRQNGCLTGMTRFFCFVVENGVPKAPFSVMRFDDSIYRIFGENLRHLTTNRELIIDKGTYDERSTSCALLPGIIAENVRFTL